MTLRVTQALMPAVFIAGWLARRAFSSAPVSLEALAWSALAFACLEIAILQTIARRSVRP